MKKPIIIAAILIVLGLMVRPPVEGGKLTSWWGIRPGSPGGWFHTGSDIGHSVGTPVNPVAPGTIKITSNDLSDDRGLYILISHLGLIESRYYHLDSISVSAGDKVNHKSVIGRLGNTGLSTGPHLHYEIRLFGIPLPAFLLSIPGIVFKKIF